MRSRPRSSFVKTLKARRCTKCGGALNNQVKRCKRCHSAQAKPTKR